MSSHEDWSEHAASYALDVLDDDQRIAFEAHLGICAACREDVRSFRDVAGMLALAASPATPAPSMKSRILAQVSGPAGRAARGADRIPPPRRPGWQTLAMAASLVLAVASLLLYGRERGRRDDLLVQLAAEQETMVALEMRLTRLDSLGGARDSLLAAILSENVRTVTLAAQGRQPSARLYWNAQRGVVVIAAFDLEPAPPGRTYQLWGIPEGQQPVSLGTFNTGADGRTAIALPVDPAARFRLSAITEEPSGGSPQPTMQPFLTGEWAAPE